MTASERRIATRAAVLETMRKTGLDYDSSFEFVMATRGDLAGEMARPAQVANAIDDPAAAADRRDRLQKLIREYAQEIGLDPVRDYDKIFNRIAALHKDDLFAKMTVPYRSPEIRSASNPASPHTPPAGYRPYRDGKDAESSTLQKNPRVKTMAA